MAFIPKTIVKAAALQIKNESADRANTATRVGTMEGADVDSAMYGLDVSTYGAVAGGPAAANDTAIALAIVDALAIGASLWWPPGASTVVYDVSANIANFHSVKHRGPGAVKRGSDTFYVEPKSSQTNRLYLSATGNAANDGLTAALPMATPQNAFDALKSYGPMLEGTWRIVCAAGTWNGTVHRNQHTVPSKNPVIIEGPSVGGHPNVPTAIFDGATGAVLDDWCIRAVGYGVQIDLRDLKGRNYVGLSDSSAFTADYGAAFYSSNIHGSGNSYADVYLQGCTTVRCGGGIWASPRGAMINSCGDTTLGYGTGVRFSGNTGKGVEWARGSEGHIDNCEFLDCAVGVDVFHNARVHLQTNNFKRSTNTAIRAMTGGFYYDDANTFNDGTADENAKRYLNYAFSGESDGDLWLAQSERLVAIDKNTYTHTGTNATTVILTPYTIKANFFEDPTKKLRVRVTGEFTTAAAPTRVGVNFNATQIDQTTLLGSPAAGSLFAYDCTVIALAKDSQTYNASLTYNANVAGPAMQSFSRAADTDAAIPVGITLKLNNAGDTAKIFTVEVWMTG
jgi:hypothetical protein